MGTTVRLGPGCCTETRGLPRNFSGRSLVLLSPKGLAFLVWTLPDVGRSQAILEAPSSWLRARTGELVLGSARAGPGARAVDAYTWWRSCQLRAGSMQAESRIAPNTKETLWGYNVAVTLGCLHSWKGNREEGRRGEGRSKVFVYRSVPVSSPFKIAFPGGVDKCTSARGLRFATPALGSGGQDALRIPV